MENIRDHEKPEVGSIGSSNALNSLEEVGDGMLLVVNCY
jgi:hypothetical protein